jgi:hypothetical protein
MDDPAGVALGREAATAAAQLGDDRLAARAWIGVFDGLLLQKQTPTALRELAELMPVIAAVTARAGDPELLVEWRGTLVGYHLLRSDPDAALAAAEEAVRMARASLPAGSAPLERALRRHALALHWLNRNDEVGALLPELLAISRARAAAHPDLARVLTLALAHAGDTRRHDDAVAHALEALAIVERAFGPDHPKAASAAAAAGDAQRLRGDLPAAKRLLERAVTILGRAREASPVRELRVRSSLGQVDLDAGDAAAALAALTVVQREHVAAFGDEDPFTARRLAEAHALLGQWAEAHRVGSRARESFARSFGEDGGLTQLVSCFVAWSLVELGRAREALPVLERVATCDACPPNVRAITAALLARAAPRDRAPLLAAEARGWAAGLHPGYRGRLERLLARAEAVK